MAVAAAALVCAAAGPAAADWLVLHDGSMVETEGPWRVKGRLVVFNQPGGQLASLRLSEVDLAASDEATAAALAPPAEPVAVAAPAPKKATVVITDADIPRAVLPPPDAEEDGEALAEGGGESAAEQGSPAAPASDEVVVLSWEQVDLPSGDGLRIYGTLQNQGRRTVVNATMKVSVYDADGKLIDSRDAELTRTELPTDARSNFSVSFVGVFGFAAARFEPSYRTFVPRVEPTGEAVPEAEPPPTAD
jgi:hypothetical protein